MKLFSSIIATLVTAIHVSCGRQVLPLITIMPLTAKTESVAGAAIRDDRCYITRKNIPHRRVWLLQALLPLCHFRRTMAVG
ncbi:hypothetical protein BD779DRAFT_1513230 [Infundibulicybe gibba]|nr:hypothetical protein BD779DRAFT_1513230 [Infundibulicybe gibba]